MAKKKKKKTVPRPRNWAAVAAHFRQGAGSHGDAKKAASKGACRTYTHPLN